MGTPIRVVISGAMWMCSNNSLCSYLIFITNDTILPLITPRRANDDVGTFHPSWASYSASHSISKSRAHPTIYSFF